MLINLYMLQKITTIFKISDLRNKILFVLGMMAVFRIGASIPVTAVNAEALQNFFSGNATFGLLNIFTGGSLSQVSLVMLGLGPYITATIIMQLLTMVFPKLKEIYHEQGENGRQKFNQLSRLITIPLAILQGYGFLTLLLRQGILSDTSLFAIVSSVLIVTAGAIFLMWLGELITQKGIGNGISLLIFAGIISGIPGAVRNAIIDFDPSKINQFILFAVISVIVIAGVVFINESQRNVPVSYAKRIRGNRMYGGASTFLPVKVNQAGMIPIIFALSVLVFPQTIITFEPKTISENLQKQGAFIMGIRPGDETTNYLKLVVNRITLFGALFLGLVAVVPIIAQFITGIGALVISGTAVLIVVAVVIDTVRQIEAQVSVREY
ncbi:MAG: Protein translocase subunit SecY [Parcubacteria group bacterium GW2011_GWA2_31_28]|nr:MAG: Protein translocase subunit SecY [Parcubacteria group bacterium GW2011_GWA2_31_28]